MEVVEQQTSYLGVHKDNPSRIPMILGLLFEVQIRKKFILALYVSCAP